MDLLSKDEPLINLSGHFSGEDPDEQIPQRLRNRNNEKTNNSSNRHRFSSAYLRELSPTKRGLDVHLGVETSIIVSSVERAMKSYADGVLRVLEDTSSRLSHVERANQDLRQSVAALKISVDDYFDQTNDNYGKLNERVIEIQRSIQILRDKQDIIEAHAQLTKLQITGKGSTAESEEAARSQQQQNVSPQLQPQQQLRAQQSLQVSTLTQPSGTLANPATPMQRETVQYVQQEAPMQIIQQVPSSLPSEQVQYQVIPQKMQTQLSAVQPTPNQQPLQITTHHTLPIQQSIEQVRIMPTQQMQQQPVPQQQPPQVVFQHPASMQQPVDQARMQSSPQQLQASMQRTQQPPNQQLLQQSTVLQQPYVQANESQSYTSVIPAVQSGQIPPNAYTTETSYGYTPHQQPFSVNQPLSPANFSYQQQSGMLQQPVPNVLPNAEESMIWNRQQPNFPVQTVPSRLQAAQPVHSQHPSNDINGIINKVSAMGFSRDQAQSVIRHLLQKEQSIDMNVVLDILMNGNQRR